MGNCLDKSYSSSDESDDNTVDSRSRGVNEVDDDGSIDRRNRTNRSNNQHRSHRSSSSSNRYTNLIEEATSSATSLTSSSSQHRHNHNHHNRSRSRTMRDGNSIFSGSQNINRVNCMSHSLNNGNRSASLGVPFSSSVPVSGNGGLIDSSPSSALTAASPSQQVFYLTPNTQRTVDQLTEEEQIKLLKRMTLIQQLPTGSFDENKKHKECVICMIDFEKNDTIKYLPCMHTFHQSCIDTWLLRSLICPSCMEPVDAGLLAAYE